MFGTPIGVTPRQPFNPAKAIEQRPAGVIAAPRKIWAVVFDGRQPARFPFDQQAPLGWDRVTREPLLQPALGYTDLAGKVLLGDTGFAEVVSELHAGNTSGTIRGKSIGSLVALLVER